MLSQKESMASAVVFQEILWTSPGNAQGQVKPGDVQSDHKEQSFFVPTCTHDACNMSLIVFAGQAYSCLKSVPSGLALQFAVSSASFNTMWAVKCRRLSSQVRSLKYGWACPFH